jgi:hypothetical protein
MNPIIKNLLVVAVVLILLFVVVRTSGYVDKDGTKWNSLEIKFDDQNFKTYDRPYIVSFSTTCKIGYYDKDRNFKVITIPNNYFQFYPSNGTTDPGMSLSLDYSITMKDQSVTVFYNTPVTLKYKSFDKTYTFEAPQPIDGKAYQVTIRFTKGWTSAADGTPPPVYNMGQNCITANGSGLKYDATGKCVGTLACNNGYIQVNGACIAIDNLQSSLDKLNSIINSSSKLDPAVTLYITKNNKTIEVTVSQTSAVKKRIRVTLSASPILDHIYSFKDDNKRKEAYNTFIYVINFQYKTKYPTL